MVVAGKIEAVGKIIEPPTKSDIINAAEVITTPIVSETVL